MSLLSRKNSPSRVAHVLFWAFRRVGPVLFFSPSEVLDPDNSLIPFCFPCRIRRKSRAPKYLYKVLCTDKAKDLCLRGLIRRKNQAKSIECARRRFRRLRHSLDVLSGKTLCIHPGGFRWLTC